MDIGKIAMTVNCHDYFVAVLFFGFVEVAIGVVYDATVIGA